MSVTACFTDSGRSSLRLIANSSLRHKKWLIPEFLPILIVDILNAASIAFQFYSIHDDFTIDEMSLQSTAGDVVLIINYFGLRQASLKTQFPDTTVFIEDNAFLPIVENHHHYTNWIGFNSLSKISAIKDGSILRSSIDLAEPDSGITQVSLFQLLDLYRKLDVETAARKQNYHILRTLLKPWMLDIKPGFPSYFIVKCKQRDKLISSLYNQKIYLPVFWPQPLGTSHLHYGDILCIPVDPRYNGDDMERIGGVVMHALESEAGL